MTRPQQRRPSSRPAGRPARPAPRAASRPAPARRRHRLGEPTARLRVGLVLFVAVVLLLGARLVQLQGLQPAAYAERAGVLRTQRVELPAQRGDVLDRNGNPLAISVLAKNVYADPRLLRAETCKAASGPSCDPAAIAAQLAPVLGMPAAVLEEKLRAKGGFVYLKRTVDTAVADRVMELGLPGIGTERATRRVHPSRDLASGVLGFTDRDGEGRMGVELAFDDLLAGTPGEVLAQFDAKGRVIPTGEDRRVEPVRGKDVVLTLDRDLQWYAQQMIAEQVVKTEAKNGTVVVMDVRTGELLALATAPTFDPDNLTAADGERLTNPAISDVFEPGSVNKVISAAAALEAGVVTPLSQVDVPPTLRVANHTLNDAEEHGLEHLTFAGVLAKSSNIGTVKVAQKVGPQKLWSMMRAFGFGEKTGVELPGDSRGLLPAPKDWSATSIATIPIGQGVSVNALHVASVYATIANNGVRVAPTIVKAVRDGAGHVTPRKAPAQRRVISAQVAQQIRTMLESVVTEHGTAPMAAIPGYRVAGKTGTAQRVATSGPREGRYDGTYTSSFIGMAPAEAPRFVTAVILQGTGKRGYYGGAVAGPLFAKVTGFALRAYEVPPTGKPARTFRLEARPAPKG